MTTHIVKIKSIEKITHDVLKIVTEKPKSYTFTPGQATTVCINKIGCKEEKHPFTFTNLPTDIFLEFIIKTYPSREGLTNELLKLEVGDELTLHDAFGTITYKGEGLFIAGGAGVTPFISILRHLKSINKIGNNTLIFANKTKADIILEPEFSQLLGANFITILSDEKIDKYLHGQITVDFLKRYVHDLKQQYYVCGPPEMVNEVVEYLSNLGITENFITREKL